MEKLEGKVAAITGGASGIGYATARALARRGVHVMLADIEATALRAAHERLVGEVSSTIVSCVCDVSKREDVERLAGDTFKQLGGAHIVFNNAGIAVGGPISRMSHDDWRWVIDVDLWGVIHGVEAFLPRIIEQGQGGHMLFTASFAGLVPNVGLGPYCVAKYGVVALAEVLAREVRDQNIGVSVLCPMRVATNVGSSARNRSTEYGGAQLSIELRDPNPTNAAGRVLDVNDVADLVVDGIINNELYILPHPESRESIRRRFARIDATFDRQRAL